MSKYITDERGGIRIKKRHHGGLSMEKKVQNIVRVHRPELTPQEYERRMAQIKKAAADLLIAAETKRRYI